MNLYLLTQDKNIGYDTYSSAVVAASTITFAIRTEVGDEDTWCDPKHVKAELIGKAVKGTEPGVILASFNAG